MDKLSHTLHLYCILFIIKYLKFTTSVVHLFGGMKALVVNFPNSLLAPIVGVSSINGRVITASTDAGHLALIDQQVLSQ